MMETRAGTEVICWKGECRVVLGYAENMHGENDQVNIMCSGSMVEGTPVKMIGETRNCV